MSSNKDKQMKEMLGSAAKRNKTPPIWVLYKTENLRWHPMRKRTRHWRRAKLGNRIKKKIKKSNE